MMLLAVASPFLFYRTGGVRILLVLAPVGAVLLLLGDVLHLGLVAGRTAEFGAENSSGFARFVSIFYLLNQFIFIDPSRFFFGMGAGSIESIVGEITYLSHDPTWGKLMFEYGLLGALGFFPFILYSMLAGSASRFLAACLAFAYFFLGGNLLGPFYNFLIVALVAWQREDPTLAPALRQTGQEALRRVALASRDFFAPSPVARRHEPAPTLPFDGDARPRRLSRFCP
jgi:hypothetical protein